MFHDVMNELASWPQLPTIIAGDFNAEPQSVPSMNLAIQSGQWVDAGANAHIWGCPKDSPTAWAHNAKSPSRIDGM
eukprot:14397958-Alexandrium_andersonii.AAC.1